VQAYAEPEGGETGRTFSCLVGCSVGYWTVGPYDIISVTEFPDDETATAFLLAICGQGNIRTTTLRAYTADQMTGIIGRLG
jgi:uncharacterized protein with GYD domain